MPTIADAAKPFGIGVPVRRVEDERLLTGRGRYTDDISLPGTAFAYIARSPHAHALIRGIDKSAALAARRVGCSHRSGRHQGKACRPGAVPRSQEGGRRQRCPRDQPMLVHDRCAMSATTSHSWSPRRWLRRKDAAELLEIDYDPLPAVTLADALTPGSPKVWDEAANNVSFECQYGDDRRTVDAQFAKAAHVAKLRDPLSAGGAQHDGAARGRSPTSIQPTHRFTIYCGSQHPFWVREMASHVLGVPELALRIRAQDVGGGFGMKSVYPEDILVAWTAAKVGRPVKWTADRSESIASDTHGRHQIAEAELALDRDGRILAFRTSVAIEVGAYLSHSGWRTAKQRRHQLSGHLSGAAHSCDRPCSIYQFDVPFSVSVDLANLRQVSLLERLVEKAAREMGIDPVDCAGAISFSQRRCPTRRPSATSMTAAISSKLSINASCLPTGTAFLRDVRNPNRSACGEV